MKSTLNYISNCQDFNLDEIKISLLFTDKIKIYDDQDFVLTSKPIHEVKDNEEIDIESDGFLRDRYITKDFRNHIKVLTDEGVIQIVKEFPELGRDELWSKIVEETRQLIKENFHDILFDRVGDYFIKNGQQYFNAKLKPEAQAIFDSIIPHHNFIFYYYRRLLTIIIRDNFTGANCLTSSEILNDFLKVYYSKKNQNQETQRFLKENSLNPQIAFDLFKINLPNISKLSFEDILELKEKSKPELQKFSFELEKLQFDLQNQYSHEFINTNARDIVKYKIQPAVDELVRKMSSSDFSFLKTILSEIKDPKSYAPLLTTAFGNVPGHIALLCSAGFVSVSAMLDLIEKRKQIKELKENGYYFLLDLKRKID